MSSICIPQEVVIEILSWIPVKSLLQFRCVCKSWLQLLTTDPHFIKLHFDRATTKSQNNPNFIVECPLYSYQEGREGLYLVENCDTFDTANKLDLAFDFGIKSSYILVGGACNGLLCLSNYSFLFLWNPSTREYLTVPCPHTNNSFRKVRPSVAFGFGFGFCQETSEYKVVRIKHAYPDVGSQIDVYTLGINSWRSLGVIPQIVRGSSGTAFVNGHLHWLGNGKGWSTYGNSILSFDMKDEVFQEISLPPVHKAMSDMITCSVEVEELNKYLCIYYILREGVQVWMMKEYGVAESWTKQYDIRQENETGFFSALEPLCMVRNGEILLKMNGIDVILYIPKSNSTKKLKSFQYVFHHAYPYVGSLVSVKVQSSVEHNSEQPS